jgi:phosphoserine phosphatase RsbU/P
MATSTEIRFREREELLDFLLEVSEATAETLDLDRLLHRVAQIVKRVIPHELFAILLYKEKQQVLKIRYATGHRQEIIRNLLIPLGEGITGAAAASRLPILVGDVRNDPRYLNALDAVRSELAVPMEARGRLVGVIDLQSTRLDALTEYDRVLLRLIASRVAFAIENARLYRRVDRQNRLMKTLAQLSQEFSSILNLDELLKHIADAIRSLIAYDAFSILLLDNDQRLLRHRFSVRYDKRVEVDNIELGRGLTGAAAENREIIRVNDTATDPRYIASHTDIRSEVAVPLILPDRVVGVLDVESDRLGYFTDDHIRMLSLLAPQIASAVENARLYEELRKREQRMEMDLSAARELQSVMLPRKAPEIQGLEIGIGLRPAREISGDLYDFFEHEYPHTMVAFGDSSGKGAAAALYGAMVSGLLRTMGPRRKGPALLLQSLNEALVERKADGRYVTLFLMLWNSRQKTLTMANAGAATPLICRRGEILRPSVNGIPLGLLDGREYEELLFQACEGDTILLYSDGVEDQVNCSGQEYGRERLCEVLARNCEKRPQEIVEAIYAEVDVFREKAAIFDDQTMVVLKVL